MLAERMFGGQGFEGTRMMPRCVLIVTVLLLWTATAAAQTESRASQYLRLLDRGLNHSEKQMPAITISAEEAAKRILAGGKMWAAVEPVKTSPSKPTRAPAA
jgi:hypothetical protein